MKYAIPILSFAFALTQFTVLSAEEFPKSILGFVKPNDYVGLNVDRSTGYYSLNILTQQEYTLFRDASALELDALAQKYPEVATELARLKAKGEQEAREPRSDGTRLKTKVSVFAPPGTFHKVLHAGDNYLLLETVDDKPRRVALNASVISTMRWKPGLQYNTSTTVLRGAETEDGNPNR